MDHTVLPANTPCLSFLCMRSPDGATSNWGKRHLIADGPKTGCSIAGDTCNIGSKRAFPTGILNSWHNCLLIYWRTACLVPAFDDTIGSRACEWVTPALSACYLLPVSNSVCFSSIYGSLGRTSTAAYYWFYYAISNIGRCRKLG